jgi:hypothetical protein
MPPLWISFVLWLAVLAVLLRVFAWACWTTRDRVGERRRDRRREQECDRRRREARWPLVTTLTDSKQLSVKDIQDRLSREARARVVR